MNDTITIEIKKPPLLDGYEYCEREEATHGACMVSPGNWKYSGEWSHWNEGAPDYWTAKDYIYAWSRPIQKEEPEHPPIPKWWVRCDDPITARRFWIKGINKWRWNDGRMRFHPSALGIRPMTPEEAWKWYAEVLDPMKIEENFQGWNARGEYEKAVR